MRFEGLLEWFSGKSREALVTFVIPALLESEELGHAIKDPFNWVPLLAYNHKKTPHALWVGRDCAEKLFGCEVEGDAIYKERQP